MLCVYEVNVSEGNKKGQELINIKLHLNLAVAQSEDNSKNWNGK
jgi:hypothetical protein